MIQQCAKLNRKKIWLRGIAFTVALGAMCTFVCDLSAADSKKPRKDRRRSPPPTEWNKRTASEFYEDAFSTLEGVRPDFSKQMRTASSVVKGSEAESSEIAGGGFKWSALVSAETLVDEIKNVKSNVDKAVVSPTEFKGGGYKSGRIGFGSIALSFAVIAEYDGDARWKKDAENARDLFARAGFNCKTATDQSFNEAKARAADLESLLDGNAITTKGEHEGDFIWSQTAGRPALMTRLDAAEKIMSAAIASKSDFSKAIEILLHEVEMAAVIGEVIQRTDYEYNDDDTYRGYASAMRDAAVKARESAKKNDYEGANTNIGELKKSCDSCHGDYRS